MTLPLAAPTSTVSPLSPPAPSPWPPGATTRPWSTPLGLLEAVRDAQLAGWAGRPGGELLEGVRLRAVRPQVAAARLAGPAARQAEATGWEAVWECLADPAFLTVGEPWGVLWVVARRAVQGEVLAGRSMTSARRGWAQRSQAAGPDGAVRVWAPAPVSLEAVLETGHEPVTDSARPELGARLEAVAAALAGVGWQHAHARAVVEAVALAAAAGDGRPGSRLCGWRTVAAAGRRLSRRPCREAGNR